MIHSHVTVEPRTALPLRESPRQIIKTYYGIHYHENQDSWTEFPDLRQSGQNKSNPVRFIY